MNLPCTSASKGKKYQEQQTISREVALSKYLQLRKLILWWASWQCKYVDQSINQYLSKNLKICTTIWDLSSISSETIDWAATNDLSSILSEKVGWAATYDFIQMK